MAKATGGSKSNPTPGPVPVGKDWALVMNHLHTLAKLPWTPKTSKALRDSVLYIENYTHLGMHSHKRVAKKLTQAELAPPIERYTHGPEKRKRAAKREAAN